MTRKKNKNIVEIDLEIEKTIKSIKKHKNKNIQTENIINMAGQELTLKEMATPNIDYQPLGIEFPTTNA